MHPLTAAFIPKGFLLLYQIVIGNESVKSVAILYDNYKTYSFWNSLIYLVFIWLAFCRFFQRTKIILAVTRIQHPIKIGF